MTIYEALKVKLGREPTNAEIRTDIHRILAEGRIEAGLSLSGIRYRRNQLKRKLKNNFEKVR